MACGEPIQDGALKLSGSDLVKNRHTSAAACGEHVGGPLLLTVLGGIEVSAPPEFQRGESAKNHHAGTAEGAVPVGGSFRGSGGRWAVARQQLLAERETA